MPKNVSRCWKAGEDAVSQSKKNTLFTFGGVRVSTSAAALLHKHSFRPGCRSPNRGGGAQRQPPYPIPTIPPHPSWIFTALWLLSWSPLIRKNGSPSALFFCPFTTGTFPLLDYEFTAGCVSGNHHVGRCLAMPTLHEAYL